ncbi:MAG: hypothetical protein ACK4NS_04510 [Saprospiraceae bacterium]
MCPTVKTCLVAGLIVWAASAARSQQRPGEVVKAQRAEVFTRVLDLSAEEAQMFWPIYNEYDERREKIMRRNRRSLEELRTMSNEQADELIKNHFDWRRNELELEIEMTQKLRKVLPPSKIARLPYAEREFRESLLRRLQERRQERPGRLNYDRRRNR